MKLLYVVICLVLFTIVMSTLAWIMKANGEWGYGFAWGIAAGNIFGLWIGSLERKGRLH